MASRGGQWTTTAPIENKLKTGKTWTPCPAPLCFQHGRASFARTYWGVTTLRSIGRGRAWPALARTRKMRMNLLAYFASIICRTLGAFKRFNWTSQTHHSWSCTTRVCPLLKQQTDQPKARHKNPHHPAYSRKRRHRHRSGVKALSSNMEVARNTFAECIWSTCRLQKRTKCVTKAEARFTAFLEWWHQDAFLSQTLLGNLSITAYAAHIQRAYVK